MVEDGTLTVSRGTTTYTNMRENRYEKKLKNIKIKNIKARQETETLLTVRRLTVFLHTVNLMQGYSN